MTLSFSGNSGGPLVDKKGGIIGINEVGIGSLGGAIRQTFYKVSLELAENGFVSRAWTGLECQPNLDPNLSGILISGVIKDSPADQAGLIPGDLMLTLQERK